MNCTPFTDRLDAYLAGAGIRHFSAREIAQVGRVAGAARLQEPHSRLWPNILPTLRVLEWLRAELGGKPIQVHSGYRDHEYNRAIGGEAASLHLSFNAIDFSASGHEPREVAQMLAVHPDAKRLGIGLYSRFVHLDSRGHIGRLAPARWPRKDWEP